MSRIAILCISAALITISGCRTADELSVAECRTIRERELAYMNEWFKPDTDAVLSASDKTVEKCVSGELYSRGDYHCIVSAQSESAMSRCMAQAHAQQGPPQGP